MEFRSIYITDTQAMEAIGMFKTVSQNVEPVSMYNLLNLLHPIGTKVSGQITIVGVLRVSVVIEKIGHRKNTNW